MTDRVKRAMKEVWEWKRRAEETTRGLSRAELIDHYRRQNKKVQRKLGLHLPSRPASQPEGEKATV
jgi:hypothetical protein